VEYIGVLYSNIQDLPSLLNRNLHWHSDAGEGFDYKIMEKLPLLNNTHYIRSKSWSHWWQYTIYNSHSEYWPSSIM